MNSDELRRTFLRFFEEKGHKVIPSSSLIPLGDPTLLLTSAGMVQFKPYFTGDAIPPSPRLASCQKCFRVTDIDSVGDSAHLTFFEMLGNFSIGDYFKKEAIAWAWEFVTERLNLARDRLRVTIFLDDEEAFQCWRQMGIPGERIIRFGEEHNFWGPAGDTGPCGPCSEIHYDLGESVGCGEPNCGPNCRCGRFSEIWNLVFTQYDQQLDGSRLPLPKPNIDTGMGLERTAAAMQGKNSVYEADLFIPLIQCAANMVGKRYGEDDSDDQALRIVAEHGRSIAFLLADGVIPSNEGRGYVLRRVLRRAALFGRKLGLNEPFLTELAQVTISKMGAVYPELGRERDFIFNTIEAEESRFNQTLDVGLNILDDLIEGAKRSGSRLIGGGDVFRLYDTYGFPKEITAEIAAENGLSLDLQGFEDEMERQRERARAAQKGFAGENQFPVRSTVETKSRFLDDRLHHRSMVTYLEADGVAAVAAGQDTNVRLILAETPFYGEMGGQVGDTGELRGTNGHVVVTNAVRISGDTTIHFGRVVEGTISVGDFVEAVVEEERRLDIARNHTATHLLQAALRQILGKHVRQSGSLVAPGHLRFDFTHRGALTRQQLVEVQRVVNDMIRRDLEVNCKIMPYQQALDRGALAFFGEKYGGEVRVLQVGDPLISLELCGGTHVKRTGEIGFFQIMMESSIGSGIRRIEAATGRGAEAFVEERLSLLQKTAEELGSPLLEIKDRVAALNIEVEAQRKRAQSLELKLLRGSLEPILSKAESVVGVTVVAAQVAASDMNTLREMGDLIKQRLSSVLVVLAAVYDGRPNFIAMATPDLVRKGLHSGEIVRQVAAVTGGGGGGRAELGQAGGKDINRLDDALKLVRELVAGHGNIGA